MVFTCHICSAASTRKDNLKRHYTRFHTRKEHSNMVFSCSICAVAFTRSDHLKRHNTTRSHKERQDEYERTRGHMNFSHCGVSQGNKAVCVMENRSVSIGYNGSSHFPTHQIPDVISQLAQFYTHLNDDTTLLDNTLRQFLGN